MSSSTADGRLKPAGTVDTLPRSRWIVFGLVLCLFAALAFPAPYLFCDYWGVVWLVLASPVLVLLRSSSAGAELSTMLLAWWIFGRAMSTTPAVFYVPLIAAVLFWLSHELENRAATVLAAAVVALWVWFALDAGVRANVPSWVFLLAAAGTACANLVDGLRRPGDPLRSVDVIVGSHTGNTAHYASRFVAALESAGVRCTIHRFHDPASFAPRLEGDALVLAFPTVGWKPPWPFGAWLARGLPPGRGRPVFMLTTCAGGPENVFLLPWLWLTLAGWRVRGRLWAIYPVNVATFRIGPGRFWSWMDSLVPRGRELERLDEAARRFAGGRRAGFPLVLWPFPLLLVGILADNRWIDRILYRAYAWKSRCNLCGLCTRACPLGRLRVVDGAVRAAGECELCMKCVNLCPRNAAHLFCWTEYGCPYRPRWPELVVTEAPDTTSSIGR